MYLNTLPYLKCTMVKKNSCQVFLYCLIQTLDVSDKGRRVENFTFNYNLWKNNIKHITCWLLQFSKESFSVFHKILMKIR